MGIEFEDRPSDSPYVERIWRSRSENLDRMTSIATAHWTLVIWEEAGRVRAAVQGPETHASSAPVPEDASFLGIRFALGTTMPWLPTKPLVDGHIEFPDVSRRSLWLDGSSWPLPGYENAEYFVRRLVRVGVLDRDPVVSDALDGAPVPLSVRSVRRHVVSATGLTRGTIQQIERARRAALMVRDGSPITDAIHDLRYFDHPPLARWGGSSVRRPPSCATPRISCPFCTSPDGRPGPRLPGRTSSTCGRDPCAKSCSP